MIKKMTKETQTEMNGSIPDDAWMVSNAPLVLEYLTTTRYDDGSPRETSTITVFVDEGVLKLSLNDRDNSASLYASGCTLQDAFLGLEKRVGDKSPDWRPWKGRKRRV